MCTCYLPFRYTLRRTHSRKQIQTSRVFWNTTGIDYSSRCLLATIARWDMPGTSPVPSRCSAPSTSRSCSSRTLYGLDGCCTSQAYMRCTGTVSRRVRIPPCSSSTPATHSRLPTPRSLDMTDTPRRHYCLLPQKMCCSHRRHTPRTPSRQLW